MTNMKDRLKSLEQLRRVKTAKPYKIIHCADKTTAEQAAEVEAAELDGFNTICIRVVEPVRTPTQ